MKYLFKLGHQPQISLAEIEAVLKYKKLKFKISKSIGSDLIIDLDDVLDSTEFISRLGGTILIGEQICETNNVEEFLLKYILDEIPNGKIHFSIHGAGTKIGLNIKKEIKKEGRSVRYIEPKNTATILHNNLIEKGTDFVIFEKSIFVTRGVQLIEEFSERDYGKPGVDSRSGMLPPKLARIMVNLSGLSSGKLLDPFCGSGVLVMEAALLGFNVIASDISEKAVEDTKKNLEWIDKKGDIFLCDATQLSNCFKKLVSTIVTEPYMGKPLHGNESEQTLMRQADDLRRLYISSFKEFKKVLEPEGVVIFIIPRFEYANDWVYVDCIREIEATGFEQTHKPLLYHRKGQHVGREIFFFRKK